MHAFQGMLEGRVRTHAAPPLAFQKFQIFSTFRTHSRCFQEELGRAVG